MLVMLCAVFPQELPVEGCSLDASQLMHWLLPDGEEWDPLRASAAATLQQHGTNKVSRRLGRYLRMRLSWHAWDGS